MMVIWCDNCKKLQRRYWTNQGHYQCLECRDLMGFMGMEDPGLGLIPMKWNKEGTKTEVVEYHYVPD